VSAVSTGAKSIKSHRFEIRRFLAILGAPSVQVGAAIARIAIGAMTANVDLGGRAWSEGNPL